MHLRYRNQFDEDWCSASADGIAASLLISALLRLDYEVLAWDGEDWGDAGEVLFEEGV